MSSEGYREDEIGHTRRVSPLEIATADDDAAWAEFLTVDAEAFTVSPEVNRQWERRVRPHVTLRVARRGGRMVGGYFIGRAGQRFGGREVTAAPVSAVAVRPEERGAGVGAALMADLVRLCRDQGLALAPLWAAVPRFYRRWGWGLADRSIRHTVRIDALNGLRGTGHAERDPAVHDWRELWGRHIAPFDGPFMPAPWADDGDMPRPSGELGYAVGWREDGRLTGYAHFTQKREGEWGAVVTEVQRFGVVTGDATRGLLGILGSGDGQGDDVVFASCALPQRNLLHFLLADPHRDMLRVRGSLCWMQRLCDTESALRQRGWAPGVRGSVDLAVHDPHESAPVTLRLHLEDGEAEVESGGEGSVRTDTATLASWYCGGLRAEQALRIGALTGPADSVALLDAAVPRRELWLPEHF